MLDESLQVLPGLISGNSRKVGQQKLNVVVLVAKCNTHFYAVNKKTELCGIMIWEINVKDTAFKDALYQMMNKHWSEVNISSMSTVYTVLTDLH